MSNLVSHAETELNAAGLFDKDSDYEGMIGKAVMDLMKVFSDQGHSGFSAGLVRHVFDKVAGYQPLCPLTGEDSEWTELDYGDHMVGQNKRCSHVFKRSDGTAYDIDGLIMQDWGGNTYTGTGSSVDVKFPYTPKRKYASKFMSYFWYSTQLRRKLLGR